jgi:endo-1,4-beta-xylanase
MCAVIARASGDGLVCALTFDDGPNGATTERLLDFLRDHRIRAVFCVVGASIRTPDGPRLLRRMVAEGHLLGNHTTSLADMGDWSKPAIEADLLENLRIIRDALDDETAPVLYFRAPNGNWGQSETVAAALGMQSLAVVNTIDDWNTQEVATLTRNLRAAIRPGELVLAHDGGGDREGTVEAVIAVVTELLHDGWAFTRPDEKSDPLGGE